MVSPKAIRDRARYARDPEAREKRRACGRRFHAAHKDEINERRRNDREYKVRRNCRRYGLQPEDYYRLLAQLGGACAICRKKDSLGIDHNHSTNQVRSFLCRKCNFGLGHFDDDTDRLLAAIAYLEVSGRPIDKSGSGRAIVAEIVERLQRRLKLAVRAAVALRGRRRRGRQPGSAERGGQEQPVPGRARGRRK